MKRQVLFVQGGGEGTHDEWDNHLVDSLKASLGSGYDICYPRMPDEADPNFARWNRALETELAALDDAALLVGHSVGATVLLHTLASGKSGKIFGGLFLLAAPFIGEGGWPSDEVEPRPRLGEDLPAGMPIFLYHGSSDNEVPPSHAGLYAKAIPQAKLRLLDGRDHQLGNDLSEVAQDIRSLP